MPFSLVSKLGPQHLQLAEDVSQEALVRALRSWAINGIPKNPSGWISTVAKNLALDSLRHTKVVHDKQNEVGLLQEQLRASAEAPDIHAAFEGELKDDLLRMMFVCCDPTLPPATQVALTLKTLCGFSYGEIAKAFLTSEATIRKRLQRARTILKNQGVILELPDKALPERLNGVLSCLYSLFSEGYHASTGTHLYRRDLCFEALRLGCALVEHPAGKHPKVYALNSLMHLQAARLPARLDDAGALILLEKQSRDRWDWNLISKGMEYLTMSASGDAASEYHLQAAIAACHCTDPRDWTNILSLYDQLTSRSLSPIIALNRAVAVAKVHSPKQGLLALEEIAASNDLSNYHLLYAVKGELLLQTQNFSTAEENFEHALELCHTEPERILLQKKIAHIQKKSPQEKSCRD